MCLRLLSEKNEATSFSEFILVSVSLFSPNLPYSVLTNWEPLVGVVKYIHVIADMLLVFPTDKLRVKVDVGP